MTECRGDTLHLDCEFCDYAITKRVEHNRPLPPSEQARWYERMASHLRKHHVRRSKEQT